MGGRGSFLFFETIRTPQRITVVGQVCNLPFLHNLSTIDSRPPALKLFLDFRWGSRSLASKRSEGIGYSQYLVYLRAQPRSNTFVSFGRQVREPAAALLTQANQLANRIVGGSK